MMPIRTLLLVVAGLLVLAAGGAAASAQTLPAKAPPGVTTPAAEVGTGAAKAVELPGPFTRAWVWAMDQQRRLMGEMSAAVHRVKSGDPLQAATVLAAVSFVYGILHAVGPGHGKFVISSYALANARTLRRGILLAFLAALFQAISAIALVGILALALHSSQKEVKATEAWLETVSWGLIALFGAWLLYRQVRPLMAGGARGHHNHQGHEPGGGHHHDGDACRDHAHLPAAAALEGQWSWRRALALAFSIGIRPCTGAIVVLFVAVNIGLWWAGVFATFAMALGTAITVSTLAVLAVGSRELAARLAGRESRWGRRIETTVAVAGAVLVFTIGAAGLIGSLTALPPI